MMFDQRTNACMELLGRDGFAPFVEFSSACKTYALPPVTFEPMECMIVQRHVRIAVTCVGLRVSGGDVIHSITQYAPSERESEQFVFDKMHELYVAYYGKWDHAKKEFRREESGTNGNAVV